ncbi:MAG: response regulator [Chitinispirillaceae bacterium]|nr:response regulator [Chitinispirillaceae bacterium]
MSISEGDQRRQAEKLLIVDDNEDASLFLQSLTAEAGFRTAIADCGTRALEVMAEGNVDLALIDVVMPDMDGVEVARRIKKMSGNDFMPVILVTALCSEADKVKGLKHADDYLTKPFSAEELMARINVLLRIRRLHRELYQSKKRYECLYENFPHLYISIDSKRTITNCNRFFRDIFSVSDEEILGKSIFSLFRVQDRPTLESFLNSFTLSNLPSVKQRTFTALRGSDAAPLELNLKAVYTGEADDGLSIVIALEDVTEQIRLQEEQRIARQHLYRSARMASIGTLASGVAHEINNPLTAILGFSSALLGRFKQNEPLDPEELKEYLGIIYTEALRCRDIVENLSKFAREGDFAAVRINLHQCVEDAVKLTHSRAVKAGLQVVNNIDKDAAIQGDSNKIEQVFINIINNCIDFCPSGSTVTIENDTMTEASRFCKIYCRDDGPGIAAEILPKVYDPFFTTKEVGMGTGMGLAICYKVLEECNGYIDIQSEPEGGTSVILELPVAR